MSDIKKGDEVSWNWGGGAPGGVAKEVKEDEVQMDTKRGNTVTKKGEEGNPAVYVEREGHDVVKKANELNVEEPGPEHANGDDAGAGEKEPEKKEDDGPKQAGGLEVPKGKGKGRSKSRSPGPAAKKDDAAKDGDVAKDNGAPATEEKEEKEEAPAAAPKAKGKGANKGAAEKPKQDEPEKGDEKEEKKKPGRKAKGTSTAAASSADKKKESAKPKKRAATESGEPRRSKRNKA